MPANVAEELQKQIMSAIRRGNEITVEKIKAAREVVSSGKISAPKVRETKFTMSKFREDAVAYASKLPAPVDVVKSAFGLADRLVAERRKLADEVKGEVRKATAVLRPAGAEKKPADEAAVPPAIATPDTVKPADVKPADGE
jgi:hypothetical protein